MKCRVCNTRNPNDNQFCTNCTSNLYSTKTFYFKQSPGWKHNYNYKGRNPQKEIEMTDRYSYERKKEMSSSRKWRNWEEGRKRTYLKNKPLWVKRGRKFREVRDIE
jgi:hypothetical protein